MKILIIGSGSGGHIYPAISFINYLTKINISYVCLAFKKIDEEIYKKNCIKFTYIDNNYKIIKKYKLIKEIINKNKIDTCLSFGGKNGFIAGLVSYLNNVNVYICEQNFIIGKANKYLSFFAKKIFMSFPVKMKSKYIYAGNPVIDDIKSKKLTIFNNNKKIILVVCGSLGSETIINKIIELTKIHNDYNYIIIKGKNVKASISNCSNVKVYDYYEPLVDLIYNCDVIISRAGATTLSQIIQISKPSIIIPSPYVKNNHQFYNAKFLYDLNAIVMIEEKKLTMEGIKKAIDKILYSNFEAKRMKNALINIQTKDACKKIYMEMKKNEK